MSTVDAVPSSNGHGSHAWAQPWTHVSVDRRSPGYCRITFGHPPIDTPTATAVSELSELVDLIEADADLNLVVFDCATPDFSLAQYDTEHDAWRGMLERLSRAPVLSIALIRGRARGAGSEFVLACDLAVQQGQVLVDQPDSHGALSDG